MDSLELRVRHRPPESGDAPPPGGFVHIERGDARGYLLVPDELDWDRLYPLVTVLHGAGRQDEMLAKAYRDEPDGRDALFLIPRSTLPTWDLIASNGRPDLDFLEFAYDLIYRRYPIDPARQGIIGYSDGASYGLSYGLSNPGVFRGVMAWAAGFKVLDEKRIRSEDPKPSVLLEYGTHDPLFPFEHVALPMKADLEARGYDVEFRVDQGGRHWPSSEFQTEALDWFFAL